MSGNSRQSSQNGQEVSVKVEPREFCTESTEKVSKLKVEVGGSGGKLNKVAPVLRPEITSQINSSSELNRETTSEVSPPTLQPVAVLNNDACKLMDFCTNIRVDVGLDKESRSDSENYESDVSDETEYESAEQMAQAGALPPIPPSLTPSAAKPLGAPKTPGAKWSRQTYVKPSISRPPENGPVKLKKILPKIALTTASSSSTMSAATVTGDTSSASQPSVNVESTTATPQTFSTPAALQLVNFCSNIKVENNGTVTKKNPSCPSETSTTTENGTYLINSSSRVPTSQSLSMSLPAMSENENPVSPTPAPTLLTSATRNIISLPRPPNKFQYHWMNVYHWLEYDTEKHAMFCNMCKKLKKMNPFAARRGCTNFKTCTLKRHEESKEHKEAILHYAKTNKVLVINRPPVASQANFASGQIVSPANKVVGAVTHFRLGSSSIPKVAEHTGQKRDAQGNIIDSSNRSLTVNNLQTGKNVSGMQFKIIPQTITTANSGGAPVMIHKLVPTNQAAASQPKQQARNYNGFRMAYYIAKEQLPVKSVENVIALVDYPPYQNWKESMREQAFNDMQFCIATTISKAIQYELSKVNFVSLTLEDGGEDAQGGFHWLLLSVKYVHQSKVYSHFVHLDKLHEMSVEELMLVVVEWLLKHQIPFHKLIGLEVGLDKDGLITHLLPQVIYELAQQGCKLVSVHTAGDPQLSVAVAEVGQRIPALQRYNDFLGLLFDYFDSATDRTIEIPLLQEHLNEQTEEVMNYSSIMWLSHAGTIKVIYQTWSALVEALQAEDDNEARDLLKIVKQYTFIALTHFFMDFLPSVQSVDEITKKEPWNTSAICSAVDFAIASVEALQDHLGAHEQQFFAQFDEASSSFSSVPLLNHQAQQQEVADVRNEFLRIFLIELQGRYPRGFDSRAQDAFHVLHPKALREINDSAVVGRPQMSTISQTLNLSSDGGEEFQWILDQAVSKSTTDSVTQFCQELLTVTNTPLTPSCLMNVMKVMECLLLLHHQSESRENMAFDALQGILKVDFGKISLRDRQLASRVCIMMNGPPIDKFNYESAYLQWCKYTKERAGSAVQ